MEAFFRIISTELYITSSVLCSTSGFVSSVCVFSLCMTACVRISSH